MDFYEQSDEFSRIKRWIFRKKVMSFGEPEVSLGTKGFLPGWWCFFGAVFGSLRDRSRSEPQGRRGSLGFLPSLAKTAP
jgi:hypothetical protein